MNTIDKINRLEEQLKKNEEKLAAVKERQQKVDAKIKELNQKRRSLQMKSINKTRAANRKRHILLGEVLEQFMGEEIDPDVFEVFLHSFKSRIYTADKKDDKELHESLQESYKEWLASNSTTKENLFTKTGKGEKQNK